MLILQYKNASVEDLISTTVIDNGTNPTVLAVLWANEFMGYLANNRVEEAWRRNGIW